MTVHRPHTTTGKPGPYVTSAGWTGHPLTDLSWQRIALCSATDPDLFHPEIEEGHQTSPMAAIKAAKSLCRTCPARTACFAYSIERRERFGVWGEIGRTERRRFITLITNQDATHNSAQEEAA